MILQKKIKMKYQGNKFSFFLSTPFLTKLNSDLIKNKTTIKNNHTNKGKNIKQKSKFLHTLNSFINM